jgi:mono/diheme cytochrome c family protein
VLAIAFIAVWIVIGIAIVLVASRGGPRRARARLLAAQSRSGRRAALLVFSVLYVALGVAVPAVVLAADHSDRNVGNSAIKLNAAEERGRQLFGERCNNCHTLAAARTAGKVGPNLDQLKPPAGLVLNAIRTGRMRGNGTMPAGIVSGKDAQDVAAFVGAVAGKTSQ